jgi:hypothetical protein
MRTRAFVFATAVLASAVAMPARAWATHAAEEKKDEAPPASPPATAAPGTNPSAGTSAEDDVPVVVWPTLTPAGDEVGATAVHKPGPGEGAIYARAVELDATLRDAIQDLGFTLDVADPGPAMGHARDLDMLERAQHSSTHSSSPTDGGTWLVSPRLEQTSGDSFLLRIVVVPPKNKQLRARVERVSGADVSVRGLVLLRDLLSTSPGTPKEALRRPDESAATGIMAPSRSPGRAVLAANAALFGAFMAFSVQRASGSEDPRLLYPLLTLGTGIGLGSALLVADEWNVSTGDAWTLAGGAWWGTAAGILIANGQKVQPLTDRYAWGVGGGLIGLTLATVSLTRSKADEGDAVLVHSGAGLGLGLGALSDYFYRGDLNRTPYTGSGYGSAIGLVAGGTLAKLIKVPASRVLLIDLGAGLGAAAGAAIGSPLVFENVTPDKTRGFVAATFAGTLFGGAAAWWFTRDRAPVPKTPRSAYQLTPYGGTIGASQTREGNVPAYGLGVRGTW